MSKIFSERVIRTSTNCIFNDIFKATIVLALGGCLSSFAVLAKNADQPAKASKAVSKNDYCELSFPSGPPVAEILWNMGREDAGKVKGRVLATGKIKVPKSLNLEVILTIEALEQMRSIEQLAALPVINMIASKLDFTDAHMQHLKNFKGLTYLNLDGTLVSDKCLPQVGNFACLMSLRLSGTDVVGTNLDALNKLRYLSVLNLHGTNLKPGSLAKLKPILGQMRELDLSAVNLSKVDVAVLPAAKELKSLDVRGNKAFDDSCIAYLANMKSLKSLNITDTAVTEKSLEQLSKLPRLKSVIVRARTFWKSGLPKETEGRLRVVDSASKSNATLDVFKPLH